MGAKDARRYDANDFSMVAPRGLLHRWPTFAAIEFSWDRLGSGYGIYMGIEFDRAREILRS